MQLAEWREQRQKSVNLKTEQQKMPNLNIREKNLVEEKN